MCRQGKYTNNGLYWDQYLKDHVDKGREFKSGFLGSKKRPRLLRRLELHRSKTLMPHNVKFNEPDLEEDYAAPKCETYFEELLKNFDPGKQFPV